MGRARQHCGFPIAGIALPANASDTKQLPQVVERAQSTLPRLRPQCLLADEGYYALCNFQILAEGIIPIIAVRSPEKGELYDGIYAAGGYPTCVGKVPMRYAGSDAKRGSRFQRRPAGCRLKRKIS